MKSLSFLLLAIYPLHAAPLTIVAGVDVQNWPRTIASEIGSRQRGAGTVFIVDVDRTAKNFDWTADFAAATSIHFIGIGRGADAIASIAIRFPSTKIDQFTTIDPTPTTLPGNVLFADNYFETDGPVKGFQVIGAFNQQMTAFGPDYSASLLSWYYSTILDTTGAGYPFADCAHGLRPLEGFRSRRVGQPKLEFVLDAKAHTLQKKFSGGTTGKYFWQWSSDLGNWHTLEDFIVFDGLQFETTAPAPQGSGAIFFRLKSVGVSF